MSKFTPDMIENELDRMIGRDLLEAVYSIRVRGDLSSKEFYEVYSKWFRGEYEKKNIVGGSRCK